MAKAQKRGIIILRILLVIGMLISLFLLYEHFSVSDIAFCSFGSEFDCNIVNKSPYANVDGISYLLTMDYKLPLPLIDVADQHFLLDLLTSNAFLGFLTLLLVFGMSFAYTRKRDFWFIKKSKVLSWMRGIFVFGLLYGFYLIYIQHFILKSYCIFCLGLDLILLISCILVWRESS